MAWLGVAYGMMASSLWPGVAYVVPRSSIGTAFGLMDALQNVGSGTMTLAVNAIFQANTTSPQTQCNTTNASQTSANCTTTRGLNSFDHHGYDLALMLFMASSVIAVLLCCWNYGVDKRDQGVLNATPTEREDIGKDPERRTSGKYVKPFINHNEIPSETIFLYGE